MHTSCILLAKSQRFFEEAMKHGHVKSLIGKMLFMGAAWSGKTSSKHAMRIHPHYASIHPLPSDLSE